MKRLLIFLSLFTYIVVSAQDDHAELLNQRSQYYQQYKIFKDTMTIRTWINMVELSKRLESVVMIDNQLLDTLSSTTNNPNLQSRVKELVGVRDQLIAENVRLNASNSKYSKRSDNYVLVIIVTLIILVILLLSWIKYMSLYKKLEKNSGKNNEKILNLKQTHKEELDALKIEIEKLNEDKLMMENNAKQIKKSYEILKSERNTSAKSVDTAEEDALEDVKKEMKALSTEIANLLGEKEKMEKALKKAEEELESQKKENTSIQDELGNLLNRIKKEE